MLINIATYNKRSDSLEKTIESIEKADWSGIDYSINWHNNDERDIDYGAKAKFLWQYGYDYDYYFTCDDDLIYHEDYFKHLIKKVEEKKRKAVVGVHASIYRSKKIKNYYKDQEVIHFTHTMHRDRFVTMLGTGTMCFHKSLFENVNLFEEIRFNNMVDPEFLRICVDLEIPRLCVKRPSNFVKEVPNSQNSAIWKQAAEDCSTQTAIVNSIGTRLIQIKKV